MSKLEYRSFAYDRRSTDAPTVEVRVPLGSQKTTRNICKFSFFHHYSQFGERAPTLQLRWPPLAAAEVGVAAPSAENKIKF